MACSPLGLSWSFSYALTGETGDGQGWQSAVAGSEAIQDPYPPFLSQSLRGRQLALTSNQPV